MAVTLTNSGSLNTTLDNYGISVLSNTSSVNLGAVSLKFNVPGGVIVKDVNAGISATVSFLQKDKNLYIALFTTSNWTVNTNNTILSITASGMSTGSFTLDTDEDWYNEFASGSGDVFQNFDIRMPTLAANLTRVSGQLGVNSILSGINPTVNAPSSSVFGFNNTTTGTASFAEGVGTLASGFAAHAAGVNTTASGYAAFSVGIETDADGVGSFAAGSGSNATGTASFAGGIRSLASGIASFAIGSSTTASGVTSLTAGTNTKATAQGSVAFGSSTIAQGVNSFAIGSSTTANTEASFAAGIGTFTEAIGQTTVGQWNDKLSDTKNVFLIGGGLNDSTRHNLFRAVGGKNSTNGTAERQIIINVTSPTPELNNSSFFVVSGSSKFITGENETIELSGPTTITGTNTLSVGGTTTLTGRLTANGAITTTSVTASAVSASLIGTSNNVNLQLQANNTTRVFISSSGNVGIGTTSPTERLHIDGNLLVTGRITAEEFHTEFVSASIIYQSGSTKFGNSLDDIHQFTGSLNLTGSLSVKGPLYDNLGTAGTPDQILFTTSTGLEWRDNIANSAQDLIITGKNVGLTTISKGTPLYFTSSGTSGNIVGILPADAGNPNRMPAGGVAGEQITAGNEGDVYIYGFISGVNTSAFSSGDDVFVAVGGGYTNIKPTGSAFIQKLGNVEKVDSSNGSGVIQGPSWYNDLPNWEIGRVMVGRSTGQPVTSSLVYLDEANGRLGLGTTSPISTLTVAGGDININTGYGIGGNNVGSYTPFIRYNTNAGIVSSSFGHTTAYMLSDAGGLFGANDISFYAGAVTQPEIMRIVGSTGFVGIGESSPSAKLEIRGSGSTSATTALRVENSNATASLTILNDGTSAFNTNHLYVSSSGLVGIGTISPTAELHISGANADNLFRVSSPTAPSALFVSGSGNIGIGLLTPSASLHISGANNANLLRVSSPSASAALFVQGTGNVGIGTSTPTGVIDVAQGGNSRIIVSSDTGNVGIQEPSPQERIHIASDPSSNKYLRIDALQYRNDPPLQGSSPKDGYGLPGTNYLGEPDYWMEIKLNGNGVLIPCYSPA